MLYAGRFRDIRPEAYGEIWLIVRKLAAVPRNPLGNIRHVRIISPSQRLLYETKELQRRGKFTREKFDSWYAPLFLEEMLAPEPKAKLEELAELSLSKDILIACYCSNEDLCHRKLVRMIIDAINEGRK